MTNGPEWKPKKHPHGTGEGGKNREADFIINKWAEYLENWGKSVTSEINALRKEADNPDPTDVEPPPPPPFK